MNMPVNLLLICYDFLQENLQDMTGFAMLKLATKILNSTCLKKLTPQNIGLLGSTKLKTCPIEGPKAIFYKLIRK